MGNIITVFGATGHIGSDLIKLFSKAEYEIIAVTRTIAKAVVLPFVKWKQADIADPKSLNKILKNSRSVFLLSGQSPEFEDEQKNVIKAAKESGVKHIVKLSSGAADKDSNYHIPRSHGAVEDFLISSGINYTMLRPNGIMQNWLGEIAESIKRERKFYESTGEGKRAHVDRRDIAEVAFKCLTQQEKHHNKIYLLTSGKAVSYYEVAEAISKAIKEKVEYVPISLEQAKMEQKGMPLALVETFIAYDKAQRDGKTAIVTDCVRSILGKASRTLEDFATDYALDFK